MMKTIETSSTSSASSFFSTAAKKKKTMKMSLGLKRRTPSSSLLGRLVVRAAATDATDENESSSSSSSSSSSVVKQQQSNENVEFDFSAIGGGEKEAKNIKKEEEEEQRRSLVDPLSPEFTKIDDSIQSVTSGGILKKASSSSSLPSSSANSTTVVEEEEEEEEKEEEKEEKDVASPSSSSPSTSSSLQQQDKKNALLGAASIGALAAGFGASALSSAIEGFAPMAAFEQLVGLGATLKYGPEVLKPLLSERGRQEAKISAAEKIEEVLKDESIFNFMKSTGNKDLDERLKKAMSGGDLDWESQDAKVLRAIVTDFVSDTDFQLMSQGERLKALQTLPEKLEKAQDLVYKAQKEAAEFESQVKSAKLEARMALDKRTKEIQDLQRSSEQTVSALTNQISLLSGQNLNNREAIENLKQELLDAKKELEKFENMERDQTQDFLNAEAQNTKVIDEIRNQAKLAERALLEQMEFVRNETKNEIETFKADMEVQEQKMRADMAEELEKKKQTLEVQMSIPLEKANARIVDLEQKYHDISVKLIQRKHELAIANELLKSVQNELFTREQAHDEEIQSIQEELTKAKNEISLLEASIIEATENEGMRVANIERQLANEKFAHESAKLASYEAKTALKEAELAFDAEKKQLLVNLAQQLENEKNDYEKDAEMAVKEIEMIELEVEESKKTKISLEQELTKMHQHYEETTLRANERNRSLQSELENMKNRVQASAAKAEEMEKAQMEALQQIQMERANFASEKEEMRQEFQANSKQYEREISNLHERVKKEQSNAKTFRDALMHAEERVQGFMQKITTLQTELDSKTDLSEDYKARLDKAQNYAMKVKMEAEMKVKEQMKKVWELERTLQEKDSAVESLKQELHEASQAALNLVEPSEIEEMQRNMELLNAQKMEKEEDASNARADLLAQRMVNASLVEQKQELDDKNRALRQDVVTRQRYENSVHLKNVQETEQKLKDTQRNYESMKQTFQNAAKENIELKRELSQTVQIENAAKDEVRRLTALANELENRLAEADNHALRTTETLAKVKEEAQIEAMKIVSETKERAKQAESLLMKERTESAVTYSALELQLGSLQMELDKEKKQTSVLFSELDLKKEKLSTFQSEFEEREARAVEKVREDFHYQMRALEEKVLIAEAATRDAEMRAEALQQLAEKAEDDSARTFDAAVKAVTEATNNSAAAAAATAPAAPAPITPTSTVITAQSSSVDLTTTSNKTPLSKMKKADLVAACEAMNLDAAGTVPVLRARLRAADY
tara:strand:+ start:55 stop:3858 length:3804 start_codon:yes stop_codon:yes gene_type:complete